MARESCFPLCEVVGSVPTQFSIWSGSTLQWRKRHVCHWPTSVFRLTSFGTQPLIALWLGHESVETTQIYLDANLAIKEEILSKTAPINAKAGRYRPDDNLLAFLKGL
jgi:hypothetical protein